MRMRHACSDAWMTEPHDPQDAYSQYQLCDYAVKTQDWARPGRENYMKVVWWTTEPTRLAALRALRGFFVPKPSSVPTKAVLSSA